MLGTGGGVVTSAVGENVPLVEVPAEFEAPTDTPDDVETPAAADELTVVDGAFGGLCPI